MMYSRREEDERWRGGKVFADVMNEKSIFYMQMQILEKVFPYYAYSISVFDTGN